MTQWNHLRAVVRHFQEDSLFKTTQLLNMTTPPAEQQYSVTQAVTNSIRTVIRERSFKMC